MTSNPPAEDDAEYFPNQPGRFLDYRNQVDVQVRWTSYPHKPASTVWKLVLEGPIWGSDDVVSTVYDALTATAEDTPPHSVSDQRNTTSWGASGGGESIVFWVADSAASGVIGSVVWAALQELRGRYLARQPAGLPLRRSLERVEAEQLARWHVSSAYDLEVDAGDSLSCISEELHPAEGSYEFVFTNDSDEYTVRIHTESNLPVLTEMKRVSLA